MKRFLISVIVLLSFWMVVLVYIPPEWHLFLGWGLCAVSYGATDLRDLIKDYNKKKVK